MNITILFAKTYLVKLDLGKKLLYFISETFLFYRFLKLLLVFQRKIHYSSI